jgi:hypothetical protein
VLLLKTKFRLVLPGVISLAVIAAASGRSETVAPKATYLTQTQSAQRGAAREISFPVAIEWNSRPGVSKYRLQIAADEKFQDVFFDGRVMGSRYLIRDLPAGYYFWRVASADSSLGNFSTPVRIFISGGVVTPLNLPNRNRRARAR